VAVALIVAAGRGERLGSGRPKALVTLAGRAMLDWSVEALRGVDDVHEIIVALPAGHLAAAPAGTTAVAGGELRSQSVIAALAAAAQGGDPVIVHDAARPLARPELFADALEALRREGADAVVCAARATDTIKQVAAGSRRVLATLDREQLWAVQTPQVFRRSVLERLLTQASEEQLRNATDEAMLVEQSGGTVIVVPAPHENLKVTSPVDLRLAELLLSERCS
jgi:2-C-methyl-D-erythritol 4-phosphate cytidylyltransferase